MMTVIYMLLTQLLLALFFHIKKSLEQNHRWYSQFFLMFGSKFQRRTVLAQVFTLAFKPNQTLRVLSICIRSSQNTFTIHKLSIHSTERQPTLHRYAELPNCRPTIYDVLLLLLSSVSNKTVQITLNRFIS